MTAPSPRGPEPRYRIIDLLAKGGMAEVYRAEANGLGGFTKRVAIKRILPHLSTDSKFVGMFLDEARLGARLNHSNCVSVLDVGQAVDPVAGESRYFLVMEYVDGASLRALLTFAREVREPFPVPAAVYVLLEVCKGLAYAHELTDENGTPLGIVHRDVSPANVLLTRHGEVKLADFGLAKAATHASRDDDVIKGKFPYLSPEAVRQLPLDGRADVFAAGAILWETIAGEQLFKGSTPGETIALVERASVRPLRQRNPEVDADLAAIVAKALAREREDRFASAREMVRSLSDWLARGRHAVSALDIADLVRSYRERRTQQSGLYTIAASLKDVQAQFEQMKSVMETTPDWNLELPGFKLGRGASSELEAALSTLREPSVVPRPGSERVRPRNQLLRAAATGALIVLLLVIFTVAVWH